MRESLTILACALIALLTAAFVGPWLIDWSAHREFVEAQLTRALGVKVTTRGAIDLKLLPTPYLALDGFDVAAGATGPTIHAGRTRFEMAVAPLLRGALRFYDAEIDRPDIALRLPGAAALSRDAAQAPAASFERVRLTNAHVVLLDAQGAARVDLKGLDLDGQADSLAGPFKGAGSVRRAGVATPFHFATGAFEDDRLRMKLALEAAGDWPRADFDGAVVLAGRTGPAFEGQATLIGGAPNPWRIAGPLRADAAGARIDKAEVRLGPDDAAVSLQGVATFEPGAIPRATLALTTRQLDLDRLLATPAAASLRGFLTTPRIATPLAVDVSVASPAALLGGESLADASLRLRAAPDAPAAIEAAFGAGPGGSRATLAGEIETGASMAFDGRIDAETRDAPRFADWLAQTSPEAAARLRALPVRALALRGDVTLSAAGVAAKNLAIKADRSTLAGTATYTRAAEDARARLVLDLSSDAFDLDTAPDLSGAGDALAETDLALSLDARAIRVARFGQGTIDAGRIRLHLTRAADRLALESLSVENLGGASLRASGSADAAGAQGEATVAAERLPDLAAFLRRIAPGPLTDALAARAAALSPTNLTLRAQARRAGPGAPLVLTNLTADGAARGATIKASATPQGEAGAISGSLSLDAADATMLARQLGLSPAGALAPGGAHIDLSAHGAAATGFDVEATTKVAGATLGFHGRLAPSSDAVGDVTLAAPDAAPLLRLFGLGPPDATLKLPASVAAHGTFGEGRAALAGLTGTVAGSAVAGDLTLAPDADARPKLTGALTLDRLWAPRLAELMLGPARTPKPGETWASTPFAAGLAKPPLTTLSVTAGAFGLSPALTARDARFDLSLAPGVVAFDRFAAKLGQGALSGRLMLRRDGAHASLSADAAMQGVAFDKPAASGALTGSFNASATGDTPAALIAGLVGDGRARVAHLVIPRADPAAPGRVLARAEDGDLMVSENDFIGALRRELDAAPLNAGDTAFDASIVSGVVKLVAPSGASLAYDARTGAIASRATLVAKPLPKNWDGPAPSIAVSWKGAPDAPTRDIDAGDYIAAATARALAREQARIEAFEADARERAAFVRREKGLAFLRQRAAEIAAFEAEQARAAEAERQRALEAARQEKERADRERRAAEARIEDAKAPAPQPPAQPFDLTPPRRQRPPDVFTPPPAGADPSAAGRY